MTAAATLELKQRLSKLSEPERRMAAAYLLRLKHKSSAGREETATAMEEMDAGNKVKLSDLLAKLGLGDA